MDREVRKQISSADLEDFISYDGEASLHELTPEFFKYLAMLSPFGHSNVKPIYRFNEVQVQRCSVVGGAHTRGTLRDGPARSISSPSTGRVPPSTARRWMFWRRRS